MAVRSIGRRLKRLGFRALVGIMCAVIDFAYWRAPRYGCWRVQMGVVWRRVLVGLLVLSVVAVGMENLSHIFAWLARLASK